MHMCILYVCLSTYNLRLVYSLKYSVIHGHPCIQLFFHLLWFVCLRLITDMTHLMYTLQKCCFCGNHPHCISLLAWNAESSVQGTLQYFFFLFCAGSRKRHSCGPVGQSHYRPCHLFEGFGAVASKRYQLIRLDSLRSCAGMWKEPNSCEHHKFMRTLWPALKLRITSGTSQQHAKCGCCKWEVAAVENSGDTLWRHVVETRCGDTLCHHFYPVDWCR